VIPGGQKLNWSMSAVVNPVGGRTVLDVLAHPASAPADRSNQSGTRC
jgi:hypothetical protein